MTTLVLSTVKTLKNLVQEWCSDAFRPVTTTTRGTKGLVVIVTTSSGIPFMVAMVETPPKLSGMIATVEREQYWWQDSKRSRTQQKKKKEGTFWLPTSLSSKKHTIG